jgi:ribosomal protein S12 methylthiotransferase
VGIKIGMVSLGCAKNRVDAEVMLGVLAREGFELESDPQKADAIIVNTCGFIEAAKQESIDAILEMADYKRESLKALIVTGCLSKRYIGDLPRELPEVDAFLGIGETEKIAQVVRDCMGGKHVVDADAGYKYLEDVERVLTTPGYTAYIKIADGCNNRCAFCAIPYIRGNYISRSMENIEREARMLAEKGVKEIVLIAQDTTYYGKDLYHEPKLAELMERVAAIEGIHWVRALYCYPELIDDHLLRVMKENPKICPYLDIPLQHINDKVLKEMNRRGDGALIRGLYKKIRDLGGFALRTTMIAGFPGETEEQFQELLTFIKECPFDRLGVFAFSEEEGTPAAVRADQVPMRVRKAREGKIMRAQKAISRAFNRSRIGSVCEVLIEGQEESGLYYGRSQWEAPETDGKVYIKLADGLEIGSFVKVRIVDAEDYDVTGVLE